MNKFVLVFLLLCLSLSCGRSHVFDESHTFESLIWNRFDIIEMDVPVQADERGFDFVVRLIHTEAYAYDFINMNITFYMPGGAMRSRDYTFRLQDEDGNWLSPVVDGFIEADLPVISGLKFYEDGICRVRMENKMTRFNTAGIKSVGLSVRKSHNR